MFRSFFVLFCFFVFLFVCFSTGFTFTVENQLALFRPGERSVLVTELKELNKTTRN